MQQHRSFLALSVSLAFLAGYVDALGFLQMGGIFVSFMSGNMTRLGVGLFAGETAALTAMVAAILALFVAGVVAGSLLGHVARPHRSRAIMAFVVLLLALAGFFETAGFTFAAMAFMTLAMGAVNTLFEKDGEVSVAVTYMTGTLVRMGHRIAHALVGGPRTAWLRYFILWAGLVGGAAAGAVFYAAYGFSAIWPAALGALAIFFAVVRMETVEK